MTDSTFIGDLDALVAGRLVEAASDLVLMLDDKGTVLDVHVHNGSLPGLKPAALRGRRWLDVVTEESRDKVRACLRDATAQRGAQAEGAAAARWRQVNHPVPGGDDLPVLYLVIPVDGVGLGDSRLIAFGRELRSTVALQRRLVDAQQTMERDYWRYREADTRYRHVLQMSGEPLLVVDGQNQRVVEANPSAEALATRLPPIGDPGLLEALERADVEVAALPVEEGSNWLVSLLPWLLFLGVYLFMWSRIARNSGVGLGGFGGGGGHGF